MTGIIETMDKTEFNRRFLIALDQFNGKLKHLGTGSNGRHPRVRAVILKNCQDDIKTLGFQAAKVKWQHFVTSKTAPALTPKGRRGRPRLSISLDLISDTLRTSKNLSHTAYILGCSRAYIYQELGAAQIKEFIT